MMMRLGYLIYRHYTPRNDGVRDYCNDEARRLNRFIPLSVLLIIAVLGLSAANAQAVDISEPACSERYETVVNYPLEPSQSKENLRRALEKWEISHSWGLKENATIVNGPDDQPSLKIFYPEDSINPGNPDAPRGGAGFNARQGFGAGVTAACLHFNIYFPEGFEFGKGGKLPGLYGGTATNNGCRDDNISAGFIARFIWRKPDGGSLSAMLPSHKDHCAELGNISAWNFPTGKWITLEEEVVLNTLGREDGIIRVWVDGKNVVDLTNVTMRTRSDVMIDGILFGSYFGGHDASWASPQDQEAFFSDFNLYLQKQS